MDPFVLLDQAESQGKVPKSTAERVRAKGPGLAEAINRVERASGLAYPPYYVEPVLPLAASGGEYGRMGVLYARVIPTTAAGKVSILVQFTAPLLLYGAKGTVQAVAAHEFTHYVDLVRRLSRVNIASEERATTLFEAAYADSERTVQPRSIFKDSSLVGLVTRKFKDGLVDDKLNEKVQKNWIDKNLPVRVVPTDENVVRLGMGAVLATSFDPAVLAKVALLEGAGKK